MILKLNDTREKYREFYGKNIEQMPKLIADGRVPMNVSQLMQRILDVRNSNEDVKRSYLDNYFDTGDAIVYHPDGRIKIILDSQGLREMTPDTQSDWALLLTEEFYSALQGEEFKKGKLGKIEEGLTREQVKDHYVWKILARDQSLLDDYVDYIFAEGKQRFNYDTAMSVFFGSAGNKPKLRAWCVDRLEDGSNANGRYDLDDGNGRFVGIAPEALSAPSEGASNIKAYTMADLQKFDSVVKGLEATVRPELLEQLSQLRKKL